jgi:predicted ferric reductase
MKVLQFCLIGILTILTILWIGVNANELAALQGIFAWRSLLLQFTGILAISSLSIGMILAMRFTWIEDKLNGLDKVYRLHKWLGVIGLIFVISHWLLVNVTNWLVDGGLLIKPVRVPKPLDTIELFKFFNSQRDFAEQIGEYACYVLVGLIAIALIKRFPYRYFFMSHRWIAIVYLSLIFHAVVLMKYSYWETILGVVMASLMLFGVYATLKSLFRQIGKSRKAVGEVSSIDYLEGVKVNAISIQLKSLWPGHFAGQFAFITFNRHEGAHPFSITSAWMNNGKLSFLIKALGDYTNTISSVVKVGDYVVVEGPYGRFNFESISKRQIWIGGGIGITPFIARLKTLAVSPDGRLIDLFHTTSDIDEVALELLKEDAKAANVRLHILINSRDGYLTGKILRAKIPDWKSADIWFCGPMLFGKAIRSDLFENGLYENRFHQELYDMR